MKRGSSRSIFSSNLCLDQLETRENPTVNFYGGNLITSVDVQPVYLGSSWTADSATRTYIDASVKDLTSGAYMDALTRAGYGVGRGKGETGVVDTTAYANNTVLTDAAIRTKLQADITSGLVKAPTTSTLYVMYVQPNVAVNLGSGQGTTTGGVLGYHGAYAATNGATIRYAVIAYPGGTVKNSSLGVAAKDQLTAVASHEISEAVTDPDVNYKQLGWYDPKLGEIGDITENNPNALVRLDGYLVQLNGDKNDNLLTLSPPATVPPPPVSPPPVSPPPVSPPPVSPPPVSPPVGSVSTTTTITATPVQHFGTYSTTVLTITVKPASGTTVPTGTVSLYVNGQLLGKVTLQNVGGVATVKVNITIYGTGTFNFYAAYNGLTASVGTSFLTSKSTTLPIVA